MFICPHNAGKSQMAQAFFNNYKTQPSSSLKAISAGTTPSSSIHPTVREIMLEKGFDLTNVVPIKLTVELVQTVGTIVTIGCAPDALPHVDGVEIVEWVLKEPKDRSVEEARLVRDEIEQRVKDFIAQNNY
ncbi:hypothetical protein BG015_002124 [Linnemannia schmuckeri]|uniref:Phosphotyrosine protein phosphatase I domain-containing protein n=1 Tax=Linnemannia schmuckeri TaxID=64567 RepID=A0A9P5V6D4_9FUNG|nr:hypothetical protein BG015_002124 [Linnemannia schmuckeri]